MLSDEYFIEDFMHELYDLHCVEDRFKSYQKHAQHLGFEGVTYTFIPKIQLEVDLPLSPIFEFNNAFPLDFLEHYQAEGLDQRDFAIRKINNERESRPLDWHMHELTDLISADEKSLIRLAREEYRIQNALTLPTLSNNVGLAGASITSSEKDRSFNKLKAERLQRLCSITRLFHDSNSNQSHLPAKFILPFVETLKPKEIQILSYLASGELMKNIPYHMDISTRYASNVLDGLRNRMGGITRDRLMYLVGKLDILYYGTKH